MTTDLVLRRGSRLSLRLGRRSLAVGAALVGLIVVLAAAGLATGDFPVPLRDVVTAVLGGGDGGTAFVVRTLRAPRVLLAVLVGAAFGASGAIFQSLTANPLGSPDVIGFTAGSATGGIIAILVLDAGAGTVALAAVAGGLLTALAVYALAYRNGGVAPFRLVLVGIGAGYTVLAVNWYLISRASVPDALVAERWLLGSLNGADRRTVLALVAALAILLPAVVLLSRSLAAMEVGDDTSVAQGVRVQRLRPALAFVGVALAAVGTAAAGPVAFVAFVAPQVARRLTRAPGPNVAAGALTGSALLLGADLIAQRAPQTLPVGLVTGVIGGAFLAWLLTRRRTA